MFSEKDDELAREYLNLYCPRPSGIIHGLIEKRNLSGTWILLFPATIRKDI